MGFIAQKDGSKTLIWVSEQGSDPSLIESLSQVISRGAKSLMILACSGNNHSPKALRNSLRSCPVPVCGGTFPSVFFAQTKLDTGFIVIGFPFVISIACYQLSNEVPIDANSPERLDGDLVRHSRDLVVFIDAMANATEFFINNLYEAIGGGIGVIGGGCGAIDFRQRPCVFSRQGLLMNSALVVQMPVPIHCAVEHGWEVLSGPFLVTEADGAKIKTLNYLPAFDVYKAIIEEATSHRFLKNDFFQTSKNFPLGVLGINEEILVRDPIQLSETDLICVGSVPENAMVYILKGDSANVISAAQRAGERAGQASHCVADSSLGMTLVFDCVSRVLYLGESFPMEMEAIDRGLGQERLIVGALSIGEIANTRRGTIDLLNKSIVVGNL
ncbi:FIST signal transduction protein [Cellvibrio sp.]|uniref:FIST signal transduction protein n=1 Tax=Cellvibrio sp. TaxID=1965322 RepID=UPI003964843F